MIDWSLDGCVLLGAGCPDLGFYDYLDGVRNADYAAGNRTAGRSWSRELVNAVVEHCMRGSSFVGGRNWLGSLLSSETLLCPLAVGIIKSAVVDVCELEMSWRQCPSES